MSSSRSRALLSSKSMLSDCTVKDYLTHADDETFKIMFNDYCFIANSVVDKKCIFIQKGWFGSLLKIRPLIHGSSKPLNRKYVIILLKSSAPMWQWTIVMMPFSGLQLLYFKTPSMCNAASMCWSMQRIIAPSTLTIKIRSHPFCKT